MSEISVTLNGSPLASSAMDNLISGEVETAVNLPGRFRLVFSDPGHTMVSALGAQVGASATLSAGTTVLLAGEVTALEVEYDHETGTQLIVKGFDKLHRLQAGRAAQVFAPGSAISDVVASIASQFGLTAGDTGGAPSSVPPWVGQRDVSAWELLLGLAEEAGALVSLSSEGSLNFSAPTDASSAPDPGSASSGTVPNPLQLVPDRNLYRVRAVASGAQQVTQVTVRSWDVTQNQEITGTKSAATSAVSATVTPSSSGSAFSGGSFVEARTSVPDQTTATALATGLADRIGSTVGEIEGIAVLTPEMAAGVAVSLGNLGDPFDGKYVLSSVRHHFSARTGDRTFFVASGRQDRSLLGLTAGAEHRAGRRANRFAGVVNGIVTDIADPNNMGRVKVKVPMWDDSFVSDWARVVQAGASQNHGAFLPPEVGDEVLLAFENNDLRRPVVLGGLYNGVNTPLLGDGLVDNGKYIRRGVVSSLGSMLIFFDGSSKEGIALLSSDKKYKFAMNKTSKQIAITATDSGAKLAITIDGDITVKSSSGDVSIQGNNVKIQANQSFKVQSSSGMSLQDDSSVAIKGGTISLN